MTNARARLVVALAALLLSAVAINCILVSLLWFGILIIGFHL